MGIGDRVLVVLYYLIAWLSIVFFLTYIHTKENFYNE